MNGKIVLIDGHSILNRAFYGVPDLTNSYQCGIRIFEYHA